MKFFTILLALPAVFALPFTANNSSTATSTGTSARVSDYHRLIYSDKDSYLWCAYLQKDTKVFALRECYKGSDWTAFKYSDSAFKTPQGTFLTLTSENHLKLSSQSSKWTWKQDSFISSNSKSGCIAKNSKRVLYYKQGTQDQVASWFKQGQCLNFELRFLGE